MRGLGTDHVILGPMRGLKIKRMATGQTPPTTNFATTTTRLNQPQAHSVKTRPGDLVGAGPNWVTFWSKFGLF